MQSTEKEKSTQRCIKCILPASFPGISFDDEGICCYCKASPEKKSQDANKDKYRHKFLELLSAQQNTNGYDCIIAYSGGKDSSYTLKIIKSKYKLNILALTIDNGFLSPSAISNIRTVVESLGVDHFFIKPRFDILRKIFTACSTSDIFTAKSLERASTICTACIGLVKFITLKIALEKKIPFIIFGWSPGQAPLSASIFRNNGIMLKKMQDAIYLPLYKIVGDQIRNYFIDDSTLTERQKFPVNVSPLAFEEYDEIKIINELKNIGWQIPDDTDSNSTNCLLNGYANSIHQHRFGFHPYAFELANLVRGNYLNRDDAIDKINQPENDKMIAIVKNKLLLDE